MSIINKSKACSWSFTYGDEQDDGTWWHTLANTTDTYTSAKGNKVTIDWGELQDTKEGNYNGVRHIHGKLKQQRSNGSTNAVSKTSASIIFTNAMKELHEEYKQADIGMYLQPTKNNDNYDTYAGISKKPKRKSTLEVLTEAKDLLISKHEPITVSTLERTIAQTDFNNLKKCRTELKSFADMETDVDTFLTVREDKSQESIRKQSKYFVQGLLQRINVAHIKAPSKLYRGVSQEDLELVVLTHLTLPLFVKRKPLDNLPSLILMGEANVGKTSAFIDRNNITKIPTDSEGVGRWKSNLNKTQMLLEEWTIEHMFCKQNLNTIKQIALGQPTAIKVHSRADILDPCWFAITTNDTRQTLDTQLSQMEDMHKNAILRRFITIEWTEELNEDIKFVYYKDNKLTAAIMFQYIMDQCNSKEPPFIMTNSEYMVYIETLYQNYEAVSELLTQYNIKHTKPDLKFVRPSNTESSSEDEVFIKKLKPKTTTPHIFDVPIKKRKVTEPKIYVVPDKDSDVEPDSPKKTKTQIQELDIPKVMEHNDIKMMYKFKLLCGLNKRVVKYGSPCTSRELAKKDAIEAHEKTSLHSCAYYLIEVET